MEKLVVNYKGGLSFCAKVRGHEIISDLPAEKQGTDKGPTPPELFISSLGTCIGVYAALFAQRHQISLEGMQVEMEWERAEEPARISRIRAKITIPQGFPEKYREALKKSAEACLVHNTLCQCPIIELSLADQA